jgi:osmotically-inducible protein OsmY
MSVPDSDHPSPQDDRLARDVEGAFWRDEVLRVNLPTVDVRVQDGVVQLNGYAVSRLHKGRTERVARRVPGVHEVRNELRTDDDLRLAVAGALARDPRTSSFRFRVDSFRGTIHLFGNVGAPEARLAAEEVATEVTGVRGVVSRLTTPQPQVAPVLGNRL